MRVMSGDSVTRAFGAGTRLSKKSCNLTCSLSECSLRRVLPTNRRVVEVSPPKEANASSVICENTQTHSVCVGRGGVQRF